MADIDLEGSIVLEQLAAIGKLSEFFDAIDKDDVARAIKLMRRANVDAKTIALVVQNIDSEH
jgi:hypothetical protein